MLTANLPFRWHADVRNQDPAHVPTLKVGAGHLHRTRASQVARPTVHVVCDEVVELRPSPRSRLQSARGHLLCGGGLRVFGMSGGVQRAVTCKDCLATVLRVEKAVALAVEASLAA